MNEKKSSLFPWLNKTPEEVENAARMAASRWHDIEKENREIQSNYDILLKERGELISYLKSLDYPPAQQVLVGPIELLKHIVNHLIRSRDLAAEDMKGAMERSESKSRKIEELNNLVEFDKILK